MARLVGELVAKRAIAGRTASHVLMRAMADGTVTKNPEADMEVLVPSTFVSYGYCVMFMFKL